MKKIKVSYFDTVDWKTIYATYLANTEDEVKEIIDNKYENMKPEEWRFRNHLNNEKKDTLKIEVIEESIKLPYELDDPYY